MAVTLTLSLALVALILFLRWHIIDRYSYFYRRKILHMDPKFPAGNFQGVTVTKNAIEWFLEQYMMFRGKDKLFGYYFGTAPNIMIVDMDTAQDILVKDMQAFPSAHGKWKDPLSTNLYTMEGEQWRTIRTKLSPVFSAMSTRTVLASLQTVNVDLLNYVDQFADNRETPLNVRDLFMRYITDAISSSVLGINTASLRQDNYPLMQIGERMFQSKSRHDILIFFFVVSYSSILKKLPISILPSDISDYFISIMDEAMGARMASDEPPKNDLLDFLVRMERAGCLTDDETGEVLGKITHNQLLGHAFLTYLMGFMTCRVTLNFGLYELAKNTEIQNKLREEILDNFPGDQEITYDALESMTYLQRVVDETLRKYAPAPWIERRAKMDYKVRNSRHIIEKGMKIVIPVYGFHNDPLIYKHPDQFRPDRMTKEKIQRRHPCSFMPFGIGARSCMAQRVGYLYVKLSLVLLLRRFRFSVSDKTEEPLKFNPNAMDRISASGLWLNVERCVPNEQQRPDR